MRRHPFFQQLRPLVDAEAVLFVDHHQGQALELDLGLKQGVRADNEVNIEKLLPFLVSGGRRGEDHDLKHPLEELSQLAVMLLGQDLRRREDRRLKAVLHGQKRRQSGDDRFTGADVPLEQAVHRPAALEIGKDIRQDAVLGGGKNERDQPPEFIKQSRLSRDRPPPQFLLVFFAAQEQAELEHEQFLKGQIFSRRPDLRHSLRLVQSQKRLSLIFIFHFTEKSFDGRLDDRAQFFRIKPFGQGVARHDL